MTAPSAPASPSSPATTTSAPAGTVLSPRTKKAASIALWIPFALTQGASWLFLGYFLTTALVSLTNPERALRMSEAIVHPAKSIAKQVVGETGNWELVSTALVCAAAYSLLAIVLGAFLWIAAKRKPKPASVSLARAILVAFTAAPRQVALWGAKTVKFCIAHTIEVLVGAALLVMVALTIDTILDHGAAGWLAVPVLALLSCIGIGGYRWANQYGSGTVGSIPLVGFILGFVLLLCSVLIWAFLIALVVGIFYPALAFLILNFINSIDPSPKAHFTVGALMVLIVAIPLLVEWRSAQISISMMNAKGASH